jgi:hypothetical protein
MTEIINVGAIILIWMVFAAWLVKATRVTLQSPRFKLAEVTMTPGYYWLVGGRFRKPFLARMGLGYERGHPYIWASVPGATRPTDWVASELEAEGTRFWGPVPMPKEVRDQDYRNAAVDLNA